MNIHLTKVETCAKCPWWANCGQGAYCGYYQQYIMGFKDKLKALIFGKVWIYVWSGKIQPPIAPVFGKTVFEKSKLQKEGE